jgi:hypothetical protein
MFVGSSDYDSVVTYLAGADHALATFTDDPHGILDGFSEWLDLEAGNRRSLSWPVRVADPSLSDKEKIHLLAVKFLAFRQAAREKGIETLKREHAEVFRSV